MRSVSSMDRRVPHLSRQWTEEEDAALMAGYGKHGARWEGWKMILPGRSHSSIGARANRLGLRMSNPSASVVHDSLNGIEERAVTAVASLDEWHVTRLRLLFEVA